MRRLRGQIFGEGHRNAAILKSRAARAAKEIFDSLDGFFAVCSSGLARISHKSESRGQFRVAGAVFWTTGGPEKQGAVGKLGFS